MPLVHPEMDTTVHCFCLAAVVNHQQARMSGNALVRLGLSEQVGEHTSAFLAWCRPPDQLTTRSALP